MSDVTTGVRLGLQFGPSIFGVSAAGVALPAAAADLQIGAPASAWLLTVHALALGVGTALSGGLGDSWGMRRTVVLGCVLLVAGAAAVLLAADAVTAVVGRFVLAAGSGAVSSAAVTSTVAAPARNRATVLAWFGALTALFAGSATAVGGVLAATLSWRFALVLPVLAVAGAALAWPLMPARGGPWRPPGVPRGEGTARAPRSRPETSSAVLGRGGSVDVLGAGLLTVAASGLLVLLQGATLRLPVAGVVALAVVTVAAAVATAVRVRRRPEGFLPRSLLAVPTFRIGAAVGAGVFAGLFAAMYSVPQVLVGGAGWDVLVVGLVLLPGALLGAVVSRLAGRLAPARARQALAVSAVAVGVLLASAGSTGGMPAVLLAGASAAFLAFALTQAVVTGAVGAAVDPRRRGAALGLLNLAFMVGGGLGAAVAGGLSGVLGVPGALAVAAVLPFAAGVTAWVAGRSAGRTSLVVAEGAV
ncbi:MFS transporter [Actinomycetes bacterium KLBMP 9759]